MGLTLVTPPASLITLAEAKQHLNVDFDDDDDLITSYIEAAIDTFDGPFGWLGRALMPQTWDYFRDEWPDTDEQGIRLPLPPLISVESVNYVDPDSETETVLASSGYVVDTSSLYGWLVPVDEWPETMETANAIRIRFTSGYQTGSSPSTEDVPAPIKQAILLTVRDLYDFRGSLVVGAAVSPIPQAIDRLVEPYRLIRI